MAQFCGDRSRDLYLFSSGFKQKPIKVNLLFNSKDLGNYCRLVKFFLDNVSDVVYLIFLKYL